METIAKAKVDDHSRTRERQYWRLSSFLDTVDWERKSDLSICKHDLINKFLDNEEQVEKVWKELAEYENAAFIYNHRILTAIKAVKGRTFHKYLKQLLEDISIREKMEIVSTPIGKYQKETDYGRTITGLWVEQWSVGMEGDSFEGIMCVPIKPNKYLKFAYSC